MPLVGLRLALRTTLLWLLPAALVVAACAPATDAGPQVADPGALGQNPPGFFPVEPATDQGGSIAELYPIVFVIAVAVFLLVEGLLLWIVFRYRRRPADGELPPQTHGNNLLEILWTAIPALIVTVLFVLTVNTLTHVERVAEEEPEVVVEVFGFQWQWIFTYPNEGLQFRGSGAVGPEMVLPVDEPVRIQLSADDVIHSFYVPQFLYKKDAIPGHPNVFDVVVRQPGVYRGQCAEFCGLLHADMLFTVRAVERPEYDAWVAENQATEPSPTPAEEGHTLRLTAIDIYTFQPSELTAPADTPLIFEFQNADPDAPHDVSIAAAYEDGSDWIGQPFANPEQSATYTAPALAAGRYEFYCSIHPDTMRGTLTVTD